jgi:glycosyltransferase involved in cell wall biosynthesis
MENVVISLYRYMPPECFESRIWCLEEGDAQGAELAAQGHPVLELKKRPGRSVRTFFDVARAIHRERIDILHCHDELSWFYGALGARLTARRPKIVMTVHGRRLNISRRHLLEQRMLARMSRAIICVSGFLRQQIKAQLALTEDRLLLIRNGIAFPAATPTESERQLARVELGVPADAFVVGSVAELSRVKNFDLALEAVQIARQSNPRLHLVLIGDGSQRGRLQNRAAELRIADAVCFTGVRRNVAALLAGLDVYLCSSDYEGISLSVLEAMARARPIVATRVGGNPELISHDDNGVLVDRGDAQQMAAALVRLSANPNHGVHLGQRALAKFREHFMIEQMVGQYTSVYRHIAVRSPASN